MFTDLFPPRALPAPRRIAAWLCRPLAAGACLLGLAGCATPRPLPAYEPPLARTEFQTVRTTAYTHSEGDHAAYANHNALDGELQATAPAIPPPVALPVDAPAAAGFHPVAFTPVPPPPPIYYSAAADWSRWPAGTVFRLLATGQLYQVDDYGWALAGRNTIDLCMPDRASVDAWGVRRQDIQILRWGGREESLHILLPRERFRHVRRMVLELEDQPRAAAHLR